MPRLPRTPGAIAPPGPVSNIVVNNRPDDLDEGLAELAAPLVRNQTTAIRFRAAFVFAVALCLIAGLPLSAQAMPGNHRANVICIPAEDDQAECSVEYFLEDDSDRQEAWYWSTATGSCIWSYKANKSAGGGFELEDG